MNLGDDADTTGAVRGQLAGAHYGEGGSPTGWRAKLVMADAIRALADGLATCKVPQASPPCWRYGRDLAERIH